MKFLGLQKYFLLLLLSFGIVQGSYAYFSSINLDISSKSTHIQSNNSQSLHLNFLFDLVEESVNDDSDDAHYSLDFAIFPDNNFTVQLFQNETHLFPHFLSSQPFCDQKINILNCTFLI
jgi:hypothetical protein